MRKSILDWLLAGMQIQYFPKRLKNTKLVKSFIRYQEKSKKITDLNINFLNNFVEQKKFQYVLAKSNFDKSGTDSIGIHWGQYLALTLSSFLIFFISIYKAIPSFKNFILEIIWFLNCSGFNCNGA